MKREPIPDELIARLDMISQATKIPRWRLERFAIGEFCDRFQNVRLDPIKAQFLNRAVCK